MRYVLENAIAGDVLRDHIRFRHWNTGLNPRRAFNRARSLRIFQRNPENQIPLRVGRSAVAHGNNLLPNQYPRLCLRKRRRRTAIIKYFSPIGVVQR